MMYVWLRERDAITVDQVRDLLLTHSTLDASWFDYVQWGGPRTTTTLQQQQTMSLAKSVLYSSIHKCDRTIISVTRSLTTSCSTGVAVVLFIFQTNIAFVFFIIISFLFVCTLLPDPDPYLWLCGRVRENKRAWIDCKCHVLLCKLYTAGIRILYTFLSLISGKSNKFFIIFWCIRLIAGNNWTNRCNF